MKKWLLVVLSFLFLFWLSPVAAPYFLGLSLLNYFISFKAKMRFWAVAGVALNAGILVACRLNASWPVAMGLSFYVLLMIAYLHDIYTRKCEPAESPVDFFLFAHFFPKALAGPVVRGNFFLPQLREEKRPRPEFGYFIFLFLIGLLKKLCLADNLMWVIPAYLKTPAAFDWASAWGYVIFPPVAAYCDISAYADMAVAAGGLLGFHLPQNFRFPFFSGNLFVLWTRWHITVTNWFRQLVFQPLARTGLPLFFRALITMALAGLWHGWAWNYLAWGVYHALGVAVCYVFVGRNYFARAFPPRLAAPLGVACTFFFWCAGATIYQSADMGLTLKVWQIALGLAPHGEYSLGLQAWWLLLPVLAGVHFIFYRYPLQEALRGFSRIQLVLGAALLVFAILYFRAGPTNAFIYSGV